MEASSFWAGIKTVNSCLKGLSESWDDDETILIGSEIRELKQSVRAEYKPSPPPYEYALYYNPQYVYKCKNIKGYHLKDICHEIYIKFTFDWK